MSGLEGRFGQGSPPAVPARVHSSLSVGTGLAITGVMMAGAAISAVMTFILVLKGHADPLHVVLQLSWWNQFELFNVCMDPFLVGAGVTKFILGHRDED